MPVGGSEVRSGGERVGMFDTDELSGCLGAAFGEVRACLGAYGDNAVSDFNRVGGEDEKTEIGE